MRTENNEQVEFWTKAWKQAHARRDALINTGSKDTPVSMWNRRAQSYARNSSGQTYQAMQKTVLDFLAFSGVKLEGAEVLDVGCGPGNYTLPLAQKAGHVWALDPAEAMLDLVKSRADAAGITNITYVNQTWQATDLAKEKWTGKFDLVFASMTPGVVDKETLDKLMAASQNYCYLAQFSGRRRNNLQEKLWPLLAQEPDPWSNQGLDIIYPFNILYAMGYFPSLKFINSSWVHQEDTVKTTEKLLDWLEGYLDVTEDTTVRVRDFVAGQAVDGIVTEEGEANMGLMVWKVGKLTDAR